MTSETHRAYCLYWPNYFHLSELKKKKRKTHLLYWLPFSISITEGSQGRSLEARNATGLRMLSPGLIPASGSAHLAVRFLMFLGPPAQCGRISHSSLGPPTLTINQTNTPPTCPQANLTVAVSSVALPSSQVTPVCVRLTRLTTTPTEPSPRSALCSCYLAVGPQGPLGSTVVKLKKTAYF